MNPELGRIVISNAGRDRNKIFIIVGIIDQNYVYLADGDIRTIAKPKKKKIKHLTFTDTTVLSLKEKLTNSEKVTNLEINRFIKEYCELSAVNDVKEV